MIPLYTPEWYQARLGVHTASMTSAFCARLKSGPSKGLPSQEAVDYAMRLALERIEGRPLPSYMSADMQRGVDGEEDAVIAYEADQGVICAPGGFLSRDFGGVVIGASTDRMIGARGALECKRPRWNNHARYIADGAPPEYVSQMQTQMLVFDLDWVDFASYSELTDPGLALYVERVERDNEAIERILACARESSRLADEMEAKLRARCRLAA